MNIFKFVAYINKLIYKTFSEMHPKVGRTPEVHIFIKKKKEQEYIGLTATMRRSLSN